MTLKQYLITMGFATLFGVFSCFFVIMNVNPYETSSLGFLFFFMSFFFSLVGLLSIVMFFVHHKKSDATTPMFRYVQKAFRESLFISSFLTLALYLHGNYWLNIWTGLMLIALFILYISFNLTVKKEIPVDQTEHYTL